MSASLARASVRVRCATHVVNAAFAAILLVLAPLTLAAAPKGAAMFTASPLSIDFGDVNVGQSSPEAEVVITNTSGGSLGPLSIFGGATGEPFNVSQNCQGATLPAGGSCSVFVEFSPEQLGDAAAVSQFTLSPTVNPNDGVPFSVTLAGRGMNPLVGSADSLDFGARDIGSSTELQVQFTNTSAQPFGPLTIAGGAAGDVFAVSQNCQSATLAPGASCTVFVEFRPVGSGLAEAVSQFSIGPAGLDAAATPFSIALRGVGVSPLSVAPLALDFGAVNVGSEATQAVTVTNTGAAPFGPLTMSGGEPPSAEYGAAQTCQGVTLAAGGSCTITITFAPTANGAVTDTSTFALGITENEADAERFAVSLSGTGTGGTTAPPALPPVRVPATSPFALLLLAGAMVLMMGLRRR